MQNSHLYLQSWGFHDKILLSEKIMELRDNIGENAEYDKKERLERRNPRAGSRVSAHSRMVPEVL